MLIKLQIIASEDDEILGTLEYYESILTIGRSLSANLFIKDEHLQEIHLKLELDNEGLWVKSINDSEFQLNNIRMIGNFKLNPGDKLVVGSTFFKILEFKFKEKDIPAKIKGVGKIVLEQLLKEIDVT